ncbi:hypothetical protein P152DRAFT_516664 [Eremomyces bilateralis CBS 781.70]|uniref:Uncharacterized protein n=1 Tax=Eremomyces bilateralis CBS 781.70 TaxID=1392243 RepID=A0A6G1FUK2_9PEZI|nr:uncharacterized protein P152DRAFT_516664 [Eremomyces bilateralis CBS 781.70]KAF1809487.1 hypothetical protein P152DRAFT_516664 [Eremomyces bilateralis CBS 781.70]
MAGPRHALGPILEGMGKSFGKLIEGATKGAGELLEGTGKGLGEAMEGIGNGIADTVGKFVSDKAPQIAGHVAHFAQERPATIGSIGASIVLVVFPSIVTLPFLVAGGILGSVGAGTIAAGVQAGIGDVAAGSAFAILQSAGAGGTGLMVVNGIVQGVAVGGAVIIAAVEGLIKLGAGR